MENRPKKSETKERQSRRGSQVSADAAAIALALLFLANDRSMVEQAIMMLLRGPEFIKEKLLCLLKQNGFNTEPLESVPPEPQTSKAMVVELAKPLLRRGVDMVVGTQLVDIYLLNTPLSAENQLYIFYIGLRYFYSGEKKPTAKERKLIWDKTLEFSRTSQIGSCRWEELEKKGEQATKDWIRSVKDTARKRFETFLRQKKQLEESANKTFDSLLSFLFDEDPKTAQN